MIGVVIPTRYNPPEFGVLIAMAHHEHLRVFVMRSEDHEHHIYRMWNEGVRMARAAGCDDIAILNDDITIEPGTLPFLAHALRSETNVGVVYPDVNIGFHGLPPGIRLHDTQGTWGSGGMTGFCFMFRGDEDSIPEFDEAYHWWYGDDAWEHEVRVAGWRVCRVEGVPIRHAPDGSASKDWDRLSKLVVQDRARFEGVG